MSAGTMGNMNGLSFRELGLVHFFGCHGTLIDIVFTEYVAQQLAECHMPSVLCSAGEATALTDSPSRETVGPLRVKWKILVG